MSLSGERETSVLPSPRPRHPGLLSVLQMLSACARRRAFAWLLPVAGIPPPPTLHLLTSSRGLSWPSPSPHLRPLDQYSACLGHPTCPRTRLLRSQHFSRFETILLTYSLPILSKNQLPDGRNLLVWFIAVPPAQCLAHCRSSGPMCRREGRKKRRERKEWRGVLVSPAALRTHESTEPVSFTTPHAKILYAKQTM